MVWQVLYAHVFGILIFDDAESLLGVIGTGLLALGVASVSFGGSTRKEPNQDTLPISAAEAMTDEEEVKFEITDALTLEDSERAARLMSLVPQWSGVEMRYGDREEDGPAHSGVGVAFEPPFSRKGASPIAV